MSEIEWVCKPPFIVKERIGVFRIKKGAGKISSRPLFLWCYCSRLKPQPWGNSILLPAEFFRKRITNIEQGMLNDDVWGTLEFNGAGFWFRNGNPTCLWLVGFYSSKIVLFGNKISTSVLGPIQFRLACEEGPFFTVGNGTDTCRIDSEVHHILFGVNGSSFG